MEQEKVNKKVTIYDIAEEAGVSSATVSRTISGNGYVSDKNRKKVMQLVDKYNFQPNQFARNLKSGLTKCIGFIVPHIGNMYFSSVYYAFEKYAATKGYLTFLCNGRDDRKLESNIFSSLMQKQVDGIVIMGGRADAMNLEDFFKEEMQSLGETIPLVLCCQNADKVGCMGVHVDDNYGIDILMKYLKEKGCSELAFFGGSPNIIPSYIKKEAVLASAKKYDLELRKDYMVECGFGYEEGFYWIQKVLKRDNIPQTICCVNDYVAAGVINGMLDMGVNVQGKIAVTGYDNVEVSEISHPKITTINPRYKEYGKQIFNVMEGLIMSKKVVETKVHLIEPELIVRESTDFVFH